SSFQKSALVGSGTVWLNLFPKIHHSSAAMVNSLHGSSCHHRQPQHRLGETKSRSFLFLKELSRKGGSIFRKRKRPMGHFLLGKLSLGNFQ
ncbi:MAG: hypothetical protein R3307_03765, partial [Anaerolineales bacterium]|nr:hypothetical protein [Anaerolineales bacterium]